MNNKVNECKKTDKKVDEFELYLQCSLPLQIEGNKDVEVDKDNTTDIPKIEDNQDDNVNDNTTDGDKEEFDVGMNSFQHKPNNDNVNDDNEEDITDRLKKLMEDMKTLTTLSSETNRICVELIDYDLKMDDLRLKENIGDEIDEKNNKLELEVDPHSVVVNDDDEELEEDISKRLIILMKDMETITTLSSETNRIWTELIDNEEVDPHSPKRRRINDLDNELELKEDIEDKLYEKDNEEVDPHSPKQCVNDLDNGDKEEEINVWKKHEKQKKKLRLKDVPYSPKRCVYCGWVSKSRSSSNSNHSLKRHIEVKHQNKK